MSEAAQGAIWKDRRHHSEALAPGEKTRVFSREEDEEKRQNDVDGDVVGEKRRDKERGKTDTAATVERGERCVWVQKSEGYESAETEKDDGGAE